MIIRLCTRVKICAISVLTQTHVQGFHCPAKKYQCKVCDKYGHFSSLCYQKKNKVDHKNNLRKPKAHQLKAGPVYVHNSSICSHSKESSSSESFCLQLQVQHKQVEGKKIPNPLHLITNLAYRLKLYHNRNMYLQARLDTCTNVNIMPASVYCLVFKDSKMKKLAPSKLQITYIADTVKIVGLCTFYVVHPDSKKLVWVTFYVTSNDGSILLSCKTTLAFCLIQTRSWLDYIPPRASLIKSTTDHPKKTRPALLTIHSSKQEVSTQSCQQEVSAQTQEAQVQVTKPVSTLILKKPGMNRLVTSKEQILTSYPDVLRVLSDFQDPHTTYTLTQNNTEANAM